MKAEKYEVYWNKHFYPLAIKLEQNHEDITFNSKLKCDIYNNYEKYRTAYKRYYAFANDKRIDRHKIASLIVCAIITQYSIFKISCQQPSMILRLLPIEWSVRCGLAVILDFNLQELKKNSAGFHYIETFKDLDFCFSEVSEGHYLSHLAKSIYAHKHEPIELINLLPHIFFFFRKRAYKYFSFKDSFLVSSFLKNTSNCT